MIENADETVTAQADTTVDAPETATPRDPIAATAEIPSLDAAGNPVGLPAESASIASTPPENPTAAGAASPLQDASVSAITIEPATAGKVQLAVSDLHAKLHIAGMGKPADCEDAQFIVRAKAMLERIELFLGKIAAEAKADAEKVFNG